MKFLFNSDNMIKQITSITMNWRGGLGNNCRLIKSVFLYMIIAMKICFKNSFSLVFWIWIFYFELFCWSNYSMNLKISIFLLNFFFIMMIMLGLYWTLIANGLNLEENFLDQWTNHWYFDFQYSDGVLSYAQLLLPL